MFVNVNAILKDEMIGVCIQTDMIGIINTTKYWANIVTTNTYKRVPFFEVNINGSWLKIEENSYLKLVDLLIEKH